MKIHASGEDYLEAVLILQKKQGMVRSIDLARHMGFSKPSISHAVGVLRDGGFLTMDEDGFLHLTSTTKVSGFWKCPKYLIAGKNERNGIAEAIPFLSRLRMFS